MIYTILAMFSFSQPLYIGQNQFVCGEQFPYWNTQFNFKLDIVATQDGIDLVSRQHALATTNIWNDCIKPCLESTPEIMIVIRNQSATTLKINYWYGTIRSCVVIGEEERIVVGTSLSSYEKQALNAAVVGDFEDLMAALKNISDINFADPQGNTLLHIASVNGRSKIATLLLESGINRHKRTAKGQSAKDLAIENGHLEIASKL